MIRKATWVIIGCAVFFLLALFALWFYVLFMIHWAWGSAAAVFFGICLVVLVINWDQTMWRLMTLIIMVSLALCGSVFTLVGSGVGFPWFKNGFGNGQFIVIKNWHWAASSREAAASLHEAARHGDLKAIKYFLESGADIHAVSETGWTALMEAAAFGRVKAVEKLLELGADPLYQDPKGRTALSVAKHNARIPVVEVLLSDPRLKD